MGHASQVVPPWLLSAAVGLLLIGNIAEGGELPTAEEIVAQAGKACEALKSARAPGRKVAEQARFEKAMRQRTWMRLALARVQIGDFDGAVEALNHVNTDPQFSLISVQAMRTELTGVVPPWPEDLSPRLKQTQMAVLADILRKKGQFDAALKMAEDISDKRAAARSRAQILLARAQSLEKTDPTGALRDQAHAMEAANLTGDGREASEVAYAVCRGQIRIGPPKLAGLTVEAITLKLKEAEKGPAGPAVAQEWARYGYLYLLIDEVEKAEQCFAHTRSIFEKSSPDAEWEGSLPHQLTLQYRCRAYRETEQSERVPEVLLEWERAFSKLTDPRDIAFVAPHLILHQVQADRFDQIADVVESLAPLRGTVLRSAAEEVQKSASSAQKKRFAEILKMLPEQSEDLRVPLLMAAAEVFDSAEDRDAAEEVLAAALALSAKNSRKYHALLAGWLAESGRFERAYALVEFLDPQEQAQVWCELAFQMTKPKGPTKAAVE